MKQIFSILLILLLLCASACRQSDALYTDNPVYAVWKGDTSHFQETEEGDMLLNSLEDSGEASVYMPVDRLGGMEYRFTLLTALNPSSKNYARVYLWCEEPDTEEPGEAFFLRLGYTKDNVCLCHQTGNKTPKVLISGREGIMNTEWSEVSVRVTVDEKGTFCLSTRTDSEDSYIEEGEYTYSEDLPAEEGYFMLNCKFTSKGRNAFAFEHISVGPLGGNGGGDETPDKDDNDEKGDGDDDDDPLDPDLPEWLDTEILSPVSFLFIFDRKIDISHASFTLADEEASDKVLSKDKKQVTVSFEEEMKEGKDYRLVWKGVTSMNGKMEAKGIYKFTYKAPGSGTPSHPSDEPSTDDSVHTGIETPEKEPGKDSYKIAYTLDEPGYMCKSVIYDAAGNSVAYMTVDKALDTSGFLRWNGAREDGKYLRPGLYIFYVEFYHPNGNVHSFKKRFAVVK